jgi:hypothetical protein
MYIEACEREREREREREKVGVKRSIVAEPPLR